MFQTTPPNKPTLGGSDPIMGLSTLVVQIILKEIYTRLDSRMYVVPILGKFHLIASYNTEMYY